MTTVPRAAWPCDARWIFASPIVPPFTSSTWPPRPGSPSTGSWPPWSGSSSAIASGPVRIVATRRSTSWPSGSSWTGRMLGRLPAGEFAAAKSPPDRRLLFSRLLGLDAGELDNAPFAQDLEGDRLAGLLAAQALLDACVALLILDPYTFDLENDVAAHRGRLPSDGGLHGAGAETDALGGRVLRDALNEQAHGLRQVEHLGQLARDNEAGRPAPEGALLEQQLARHVRADHEAQSLEAPRLRDDVADHADHLGLHVEHGPARVALVDGGIRLEELGRRHGPEDGIRLVAGADVSDGEAVADAVGGADDEHLVADARPVRGSQPGRTA